METLLVALAMHLFWETRWSTVESDESLSHGQQLFGALERRSKVRETLSKSLGGDWTSKNSKWETWNRSGVDLRNRVVHGGHAPSYIETQEAISAHDAMTTFLADRIANKTRDYPRTALKLVGEANLKARNRWTGQIAAFSEDVAPIEADWESSFTRWMDQVAHRSS